MHELLSVRVPKVFWVKTTTSTSYMIKKMSSTVLDMKTHEEI